MSDYKIERIKRELSSIKKAYLKEVCTQRRRSMDRQTDKLLKELEKLTKGKNGI